jgi:hypothetical protein
MRMINFGAGEVCDRLTILATKILYAAVAGKESRHFTDERNVLLTHLRGRELNGAWFQTALDLGAVNAALWRCEDELREWRDQEPNVAKIDEPTARDVARIAFQIQALNDRRAELIEQINRTTGEFLGEEKLK